MSSSPSTSDGTDEILPAQGIVAALTDSQRSRLFAHGEIFTHNKGEKLVEQGQPQAYLHVLLAGEMRVVAASDEALITLGYVQPGECVGEMTVLEPVEEAAANVIATTPVRVWCIQRRDFDRFLAEDPAAGCHILRGIAILLAQRLRRRTEHLVSSAQ